MARPGHFGLVTNDYARVVIAPRRLDTIPSAQACACELPEEAVSDEELMADGARLLLDAVGQLSAEDLDRVLKGLPSPGATEVVRELLGNKLDPRRLKNV